MIIQDDAQKTQIRFYNIDNDYVKWSITDCTLSTFTLFELSLSLILLPYRLHVSVFHEHAAVCLLLCSINLKSLNLKNVTSKLSTRSHRSKLVPKHPRCSSSEFLRQRFLQSALVNSQSLVIVARREQPEDMWRGNRFPRWTAAGEKISFKTQWCTLISTSEISSFFLDLAPPLQYAPF